MDGDLPDFGSIVALIARRIPGGQSLDCNWRGFSIPVLKWSQAKELLLQL